MGQVQFRLQQENQGALKRREMSGVTLLLAEITLLPP